VKEIEAVKLLAYDPCAICMNKTGCSCWCPPYFSISFIKGFILNGI